MSSVKSEAQALAMLTDIEKDFEEVTALKQALHFGYQPSDVKIYEEEIKTYAAKIFERDIKASNTFIQAFSSWISITSVSPS